MLQLEWLDLDLEVKTKHKDDEFLKLSFILILLRDIYEISGLL